MTQIHLTLDDDILKDLWLGNKESGVAKLLEKVFDAVLQSQASEQLNADPYERSDDRLKRRAGLNMAVQNIDVNRLLEMVQNKDRALMELSQNNRQLTEKITQLTEQVAFLTQKLYGRKTEKSTVVLDGQLVIQEVAERLFDEAENCADPKAVEPEVFEQPLRKTRAGYKRKSFLPIFRSTICCIRSIRTARTVRPVVARSRKSVKSLSGPRSISFRLSSAS